MKKETLDRIINLIRENEGGAPVNSVGDGSATAMPPTHEPGVKKKNRRKVVIGMWSRTLRGK